MRKSAPQQDPLKRTVLQTTAAEFLGLLKKSQYEDFEQERTSSNSVFSIHTNDSISQEKTKGLRVHPL